MPSLGANPNPNAQICLGLTVPHDCPTFETPVFEAKSALESVGLESCGTRQIALKLLFASCTKSSCAADAGIAPRRNCVSRALCR